jgi:hypothetical protein
LLDEPLSELPSSVGVGVVLEDVLGDVDVEVVVEVVVVVGSPVIVATMLTAPREKTSVELLQEQPPNP